MWHPPSFLCCPKTHWPFTTWGHKAVPTEAAGRCQCWFLWPGHSSNSQSTTAMEKYLWRWREWELEGSVNKNTNTKITVRFVRAHIAGVQYFKSVEHVQAMHWGPSLCFHFSPHSVPCSLPCSMRLWGHRKAEALQISSQNKEVTYKVFTSCCLLSETG